MILFRGVMSVFFLISFFGCASGPEVKQQKYAVLSSQRTFEHEFPVVWKGIETALKNNSIAKRDPDEVTPVELSKLSERTLETNWIYGQSRDKYIEYKVNETPRKKYLKTRFKYLISAHKNIGGTDVKVDLDEEIEELNGDGTSKGYSSTDLKDSSRMNELLDRINQAIIAAP
jgi:hypothetical protein